MIGIYKLTSPSGKIYIGQSRNIKRRLTDYKKLRCKKQQALYNSLVKYGYDNFIVEIIEECTLEQLNDLEELYIRIYKSLTPNGYNLTTGGDCFEFTKEAKDNCKRAQTKSCEKIIHTYHEPLLLFDNNLNYIATYNNIEDACVATRLKAVDVYYSSFLVSKPNDKIWILKNCKNIENVFMN